MSLAPQGKSLEYIAKSVKGIFWEADAETFQFTYVSPQSKKILGYPPDFWNKTPSFWKEHIHPEDREETVAYYKNEISEGEDHEVEYRMIDAQGEVVFIKDLVTLQKKEDGKRVFTGLMLDNTEEHVEESQKEQILKESYELADIGHWELDLDNEILVWSQEVKNLHEVSPDYKPDLETAINFYEEGEHRQKIQQVVQQAIEKAETYDIEVKIITAKGNERWVRTAGQTEVENGHCKRLYGVTQDITKRKSAEKKLRKTEEKLRSILENSTSLFYRHDSDHNLTYVSPQAKDFLGIDPDEDELESWTDYLTDHPLNKEGLEKTNKAIESGQAQPPYELQLKKKDGTNIWVRVNEAPITKDGETVAIVGSLTNITAQKENEKELERLSRVARETQNIVIITDPDEHIEWVNKAFEKNTGYSTEEVMGKNPGELLQGPGTDADTVQRIAQKIEDEEIFSERILNYSKEGTPYWIKMDVTPIKNEKGEVKEFFAIQEDITEQVRIHKELQDQTQRLKEAQRLANVGDWYYDLKTGDITWSEIVYSIFDRDVRKKPPSLEELKQRYQTGSLYKFEKALEDAIKHGKEYEEDYKVKTEKGNVKYVKAKGIPLKDGEGNIIALRGIVQDITARKKAVLELQQKQDQFYSITSNIDGLILRYLLHPDGQDEITFVSEGIKDLHEVSPNEVIDDPQKVWDPILDEDLEEMKHSILKSARELSYWDHKWRVKTSNGEIKWIHGRGNPRKLEDGTVQWDSVLINVTEQEKAKKERQELQKLLQQSVNEIYIFDPESLQFIYTNKAASENIGYSRQQLLQMTPLDLMKEFTETGFNQLIKPSLDGSKEVIHFETTHERKNGSTYPVELYLRKDTFHNEFVIVATILDISERKETDRKLRSLIETAPIPIYIESVEGKVVDLWNEAAEEVMGFSKEEIMGSTLPHVADHHMDDYHEMLDLIKQGKSIKGREVIRKRKNGTYFPARVSAGPLVNDDEQVESILVVVEDITEQKQLEESLRDQIYMSENILDSLPGLFYMMDQNLNFLRVNSNFQEFFGKSAEAIKEIDPVDLVVPSERDKVKQKIKQVIKNGYAEIETVILNDGVEYNFFINGKLFELDDHKYIMGNGIDITERVKSQKNNEILLKEVHHRVKNNLAVISSLLTLEMQEFKNTKAKISFQRSINRIHSIAKVHELLYNTDDFSSVDVGRYLKELSDIVQSTFLKNPQKVDIQVDVDQIDMNLNEAIPLGMLINELITNSLKYAFGDSRGKITIRIRKDDHSYSIMYHDNGKGISTKPDLENPDTLGFIIVSTLLKQLDADYDLYTDNEFRLKFSFHRKKRGSYSNL